MIASGFVATAALAASAQSATVPQKVTLMPTAPEAKRLFEQWGFSEAVIDGDRIFLSGLIAGPRKGDTDQKAAFDNAFKTLSGILQRAGSSWDDVVDITTFHTDLPGQIDNFVEVKNRYVRAPFPAWTAIDVDRLVLEDGLVEIKVIARRTATR